MCMKIKFDSSWGRDFNTRIFRTSTNKILYVTGFQNGRVSMDATPGVEIEEFAEIIEACFDSSSGFETELINAFECKPDTSFESVYINFYSIKLLIRRGESNSSYIISKWNDKMQNYKEMLLRKKYEKRVQLSCLDLLNNETGNNIVDLIKWLDEATSVDLKERITIQTWKGWQTSIQNNKSLDEHVKREFKFMVPSAKSIWEQWVKIQTQRSVIVVVFTRRWAKLMQHVMRKYNIWDIRKIAEETAIACDLTKEREHIIPISVSILSKCWEYGAELLDWYENRIK